MTVTGFFYSRFPKQGLKKKSPRSEFENTEDLTRKQKWDKS